MFKRRNFILWGIFGSILAKITSRQSVLAIDTDSEENNNSLIISDSSGDFYELGTVKQLEEEGFLLNEDLDLGAVLVMKKSEQDPSLIAIDPTCPHAGCLVEWEDSDDAFVCPCHQSKFKQDGTLIEGIAVTGLTQYQVKIESEKVWVSSL